MGRLIPAVQAQIQSGIDAPAHTAQAGGEAVGDLQQGVCDEVVQPAGHLIANHPFRSLSRQQFLYFLPLPQGQGALRPTLASVYAAFGRKIICLK